VAGRARFGNGEWALAAALAVEIVVFALVAPYFATIANFFEVTRLTVEIGLLAIALTPVIITGGIDLSVGSMMGLAAVIFGVAQRDWGASVPLAAMVALAAGACGGGLNAFLVARLRIPPLIVTLGTFSLFRGIAEGITHGAVNYTGFPQRFLAFGQGYLWGVVPAQLPIFLAVLAGYAILLHRSVIGRALYAIGFTQAGARYAGIPVSRRVGLVYFLSGLVSSLAALVYVAHLGQARSDAGNGYELDAITAVVLGGTSVFGGRGTLAGTVLGLFAISVLRNGLRLAALPSELAGVLTGTLLVATIAIDRLRTARAARSARGRSPSPSAPAVGVYSPGTAAAARPDREDIDVKNSQVAVLCAAMIAGSLIVATTNVWLVRSLVPAAARSASSESAGPDAGATPAPVTSDGRTPVLTTDGRKAVLTTDGRKPVVAMMPKAKGDPYFVSCRVGADEAAGELGVELIWDGPTGLDAARQNEVIDNWITRKVDVIAVAVENRAGISTVLRKARERGIKVLTWDADAEPDARDFFVNQATSEGIANTLTDEAARLLGGTGEFAIITGALSAANQNEWIAYIRKRLANHPGLRLATIRPSDDDRDKAFAETQTIMRVHANVKLVMAISAPAVPGAAEAVRQAGRKDVNVIGLSLPNINKPYVHSGVVQTVVLWNTRDLGYATVHAGVALLRGTLAAGAASVPIGRLGALEIRGSEIILGAPLKFTKANIDRFDF
jgi:rhamnose transport system substrate-binding protein/rhamnose transport system permease protein